MNEKLTIGKIAKLTETNIETIRYYQREKLLDIPKFADAKIRYYSPEYIEKIEFIKRAQTVGFSLNEIKEILKLRLSPSADCAPIKDKTQKKIYEAEKKITDLNRILKVLKQFESRCNGHESTEHCSILDGLKEIKRG